MAVSAASVAPHSRWIPKPCLVTQGRRARLPGHRSAREGWAIAAAATAGAALRNGFCQRQGLGWRSRKHSSRGHIFLAGTGSTQAEWMDDAPAANEEADISGQAAGSSRSLLRSESSSSAAAPVLFHDGKKRGFDPSVIRGPDGQILGGGDAPEPEGAAEFFEWLRDRGCTGLEDVQLLLGGGAALRKRCECGRVKREQDLFSIPRAAWLLPEENAGGCLTEALAWRLLTECWAEEASAFAPFVRQLRRRDMAEHPINWEDDEVEWLKESAEAYEAAKSIRVLNQQRAARLLARTLAEVPDIFEQRFGSSEDALTKELTWALALVEAQGLQFEDDSGREVVALCPLLADVRSSFNAKGPNIAFDFDGPDSLKMLSLKRVKPGEELLQGMEQASSAWLLANLGIVPGSELPGVPDDQELIERNHWGTCMLVPPEMDPLENPANTYMAKKLDLLKEYADIDLAGPRLPGSSVAKSAFILPAEATGRGRILPTARFLLSDFEGMDDIDLWMARWFTLFFQHCKLERGYPDHGARKGSQEEKDVEQTLEMAFGAEVDVTARQLAMSWVQEANYQKTQAIEAIASKTGVQIGNAQGLVLVSEGQSCMAYYKAKRKNGSPGKSRKPREARVISIGDATLRVEFVGNRRRHEIPANWVVSSQPMPDAKLLTEGCSPARQLRGKLAITLLRSERALLGVYLEVLASQTTAIEELNEKAAYMKKTKDEKGLEKVSHVLKHFWNQELVEVNSELAAVQPQSLEDLPKLTGEDDVTFDKPLWRAPEGSEGDLQEFKAGVLVTDEEDDDSESPGEEVTETQQLSQQ
eukprot:TRINITY_DN96126_c0_g1_i1.p1 TRINITY_DN96126_c0_g1~~TRINITY_DN96126_c0_g1_i1.p1  ORF type:complete len:830 (-),score=187.22 TRINITY_DN96126_c0_g1_i1:77-2518(-)